MKKLKNILKLTNLMSQHYTNSMDEICVPVIKKILGHYLELNPNYNNGLQRNQQPNGKVSNGAVKELVPKENKDKRIRFSFKNS